MGPWASAVVAIAAVIGAFVEVMAFRALVETVDGVRGHCLRCGSITRLPSPAGRHQCWRCRHPGLHVPQH